MTKHDHSRLRVLVISALPQEIAAITPLAADGVFPDANIHVLVSGVGKVAMAASFQRAIERIRPDVALLVGVAGALRADLRLGDIGVVEGAIDADFDVRAWRPDAQRGENPLTGERVFSADPILCDLLVRFAPPHVFQAYAASGSAFLDREAKHRFLRHDAPDLAITRENALRPPDLVDMESSAFLQVAALNGVSAAALRVISDPLEGDAVADFDAFLKFASAEYADILTDLIRRLSEAMATPRRED